ncbi:MAG: hypothetical protein ACTHNP_02915 [Solirubrobacterales bacterium]
MTKMTRLYLPLLLVTAATAMLGVSACGSPAASVGAGAQALVGEGEKSCVIEGNGVKSRIRPEDSGLPCSSIRMILVILPDVPGVQTLQNENGEPSWVCREYPKSALPRELRCHEGKRHFERVRIQGKA